MRLAAFRDSVAELVYSEGLHQREDYPIIAPKIIRALHMLRRYEKKGYVPATLKNGEIITDLVRIPLKFIPESELESGDLISA